MSRSIVLQVLATTLLCCLATPCRADEIAGLAPGIAQIQARANAQLGHEPLDSATENRLDFELALTDRLQTALHLNWGVEGLRGADGLRVRPHSRGITMKWRHEVSRAMAGGVDSALYLDLAQGPAEASFKGRLQVDKRFGPWTFAVNGVYKFEHNFAAAVNEHKVFGTAGLGYFVTEHLSVGMEVMDCKIFAPDAPGGASALKHGAVYGGPVLSYTTRRWWTAISVTPQVYGYGNPLEGNDGRRNREELEKVQGRVVLGVHL